ENEKGIETDKRIKEVQAKIEIDKLNFETAQREKRLQNIKAFNDKKRKIDEDAIDQANIDKQARAQAASAGLGGIGGQVHNNGFTAEGLSVEDQAHIESTRLRTAIEIGESKERIKAAEAEKEAKV